MELGLQLELVEQFLSIIYGSLVELDLILEVLSGLLVVMELTLLSVLRKLKVIMLLFKLFRVQESQQQLVHLDLDLNSKVYLSIPTLRTLEVIKFMSNGLVTLCNQDSYLHYSTRDQLS